MVVRRSRTPLPLLAPLHAEEEEDAAADPLPSPPDGAPVPVALPLPHAECYDYLAPEEGIAPGTLVQAPFGARRVVGVVWDATARGKPVSSEKLRSVGMLLPAPPLTEGLRRFLDGVAAYYVVPRGAVLKMALPTPDALTDPPTHTVYCLGEAAPARLTAARTQVLAYVEAHAPAALGEMLKATGTSAGVVRGLVKVGALHAVEVVAPPVARPALPSDAYLQRPALSPAQAAAADALKEQVRAGGHGVTLIDGVTGSGKTEVYFEAVEAALQEGKQALVLLPEIALGAQWVQRCEARFGITPTVWHSAVTPARRREAFRAIQHGTARLIMGARSALFLPYAHLGLIVVDEEHEAAYKQEDGVPYQARDMAVLRGHAEGVPVVLASATPSLETLHNVVRGKYAAVHLPDRHGGASMPHITITDLREDRPERGMWLAPSLRAAMAENLAAGQQSLLFLNRRGYAPLTLCRGCGFRFQCPSCTAWLVAHQGRGTLQCHHCGYTDTLPRRCPRCDGEDTLVACGPGVERIAEEVAAFLPQARQAIMTTDTVAHAEEAARLIAQIEAGAVDVIIGTQMAAKGHHFPRLTLVGVVDADMGLAGGDVRACERTFQLLQQVAGRAGRADRPGVAYVQTALPDHPVMRALCSGLRETFLEAEREMRRAGGMPPYTRLAALILSDVDEAKAREAAMALRRAAPEDTEGIAVYGPAPAPLARLRGRYRWRLLVQAAKTAPLQPYLRRWLAASPLPRSVRLKVDVDPYGFV